MHFRLPSFDHGTVSALWAFGLGFFVFLGMVGIGISVATSAIVALVAVGVIFLYVRIYGEDDVRRPR